MKQLVCEMCGGTDLMKQDGAYVCQNCGMKYSVEEAKKLMVEVSGTVSVVNAAQLENLLKLAHSSFESKNYAQAEKFCNDVIAMDDRNYEAWKLKGEAINYQITSKNQRILEVYNCIMTSFRVLEENEKTEKTAEILFSLKTCFEGEISFWLEQFEAGRPTDAALLRAKNAFIDSYNKMAEAFDELGLKSLKDGYLTSLDNYFVKEANKNCVSAWKTTVGYNYYREDFGNYGSKWGKGSVWTNIVTHDTDEYRPQKETFKTFLDEGGNLIGLLEFAIEQFNDETPADTKVNVYENIAFFHEKLAEAKWYKIDHDNNGVGWAYDGSLTAEAISGRKNIASQYRTKAKDVKVAEENRRIAEVKEECKDWDVEEILEAAYDDMGSDDFLEAKARYELVMERKTDSPAGYLGVAVAAYQNGMSVKTVLTYISKAIGLTVNDNEKAFVSDILSFECGKKVNLLCMAAANYDYEAVEYLVSIGAPINRRSAEYNVTPLWFIAHDTLKEGKEVTGRKIAKLLLDNGADIDVTNKGGVALYNKNTDYEIASMIRAKFPEAEKGDAAAKKKSGGCYVATAVYGSYDCPQVWTLRRYRDYTLAQTWYGRLFIMLYYSISPTLVKWFGSTNWFKKMWKGKLDRMVADLQAKGVESTPYQDKNW